MGFDVAYIADSDTAAVRTKTAGNAKLLTTVVNNMGDDRTVTDDQYSKYFNADTAEAGVKAVVAAGNFVINGYAIPATEAEFNAVWPDGFKINGDAFLSKTGEGWKVDRNTYESYDEAAFAVVGQIRNGLEVLLYDTDGDGYTDLIRNTTYGAVIVNKITDNGDGTDTVSRAEPDASLVWENDGRRFDGEFMGGSGVVVKAENLDKALKEGDMALFWYGPDGWVLERALEVNGILVDGADHEFYQIDDVKYGDAMRFSRDNIIISNRCGELVNAHKYFGIINNAEGLKVSLWFVPTVSEIGGAPAGFTTGDNAKTFLAKAVAAAKDKLESVAVSADGAGAASGAKWVTQADHDALNAAIERAETVLASDASGDLMDYQVYLLYFALHGSGEDIGARFAGYDYAGFDNQIHGGSN